MFWLTLLSTDCLLATQITIENTFDTELHWFSRFLLHRVGWLLLNFVPKIKKIKTEIYMMFFTNTHTHFFGKELSTKLKELNSTSLVKRSQWGGKDFSVYSFRKIPHCLHIYCQIPFTHYLLFVLMNDSQCHVL